jgi:protein MpaA
VTRRQALALMLPGLLLTAATPAVSEAASSRPAIVEGRTIGHTVKGRAIVAWRLGQPTSKRKVVIFGAMHGDETGPSRILYNLRDGKRIRGADIWVVPQYNRDGIARRTRQNAHGVDLNRNYPYHWAKLTGATNSGPRAASEPETTAVMAFLRTVRPNYVVSFHQPLHGVGRTGGKGSALVRRLHRGLHLPVKSFNCSGICHGTMTEWFNANFPGVAVTVEYGHGLSRRQATRVGPAGLLRAVGARR